MKRIKRMKDIGLPVYPRRHNTCTTTHAPQLTHHMDDINTALALLEKNLPSYPDISKPLAQITLHLLCLLSKQGENEARPRKGVKKTEKTLEHLDTHTAGSAGYCRAGYAALALLLSDLDRIAAHAATFYPSSPIPCEHCGDSMHRDTVCESDNVLSEAMAL